MILEVISQRGEHLLFNQYYYSLHYLPNYFSIIYLIEMPGNEAAADFANAISDDGRSPFTATKQPCMCTMPTAIVLAITGHYWYMSRQ